MMWMCRECGIEIEADDDLIATWIGWTGLDGDTGICPPCGGSAARGFVLGEHEARRSERAIAMTRILIERARRKRWDESTLETVADRLGYVPEVCSSCEPSPGSACTSCEGTGIVWRRGEARVSGSTLLRLAMLPERRPSR